MGIKSKDIPCNDLIFLKIRENKLNITVCCRSNDMIWGAYGANAVQFSMLQEYIASMIGVGIGTYTQISDSFHVYPDNPKWQAMMKEDSWYGDDYYSSGLVTTYPIMNDPETWDKDLERFMLFAESGKDSTEFNNDFFSHVAVPMVRAWNIRKRGDVLLCLSCIDGIKATDWKLACKQWVERRMV